MSFKPRTAKYNVSSTSARIRHERFTSSEVKKTLSRATTDPFARRKTMRTFLRNVDGSYSTAKIDLETGEVFSHLYKHKPLPKKPTAKSLAEKVDPPWVIIPPPGHEATRLAELTSRKQMLNPMRSPLKGYQTLEEVFVDYPNFEDAFFGALMLDMGGNTRTLSPVLVLALLQNLKIISSETIQSFMGCETRHAQKVGIILRVIITAFVKEREREAASGVFRKQVSSFEHGHTELLLRDDLELAA